VGSFAGSPWGVAPPVLVSSGMTRPRPLVALVGAPNVGKSTLANRLSGRRRSITAPQPGVTRDGVLHWVEEGAFWLLDTGGQSASPRSSMDGAVSLSARKSQNEADLVLLMLDGKRPPGMDDLQIMDELLKGDQPFLVALGKADTRGAEAEARAWAGNLPFEVFPVSGESTRGVPALLTAMKAALPDVEALGGVDLPLVGIFGRPGVGKSMLFNHLLGEAVSVVSDEGPTTRDGVEAFWVEAGLRLLDTGGLPRKRPKENLAWYARRRTLGAAGAVWAGMILVDPSEGVTRGDCAIIGLLQDAGAGVLLLSGKADLRQDVVKAPPFCGHLPVFSVSGLTGEGAKALAPALKSLLKRRATKIATHPLTEALRDGAEAWARTGTSSNRLYYATQVGVSPPAIQAFVAHPDRVAKSDLRPLEKAVRRTVDLDGVPIRFSFRPRRAVHQRNMSV